MATLLPAVTITAAVSPAVVGSTWEFRRNGARNLCIEFIFTYGSSGGTTVDAYVQTSLDGGTTWIDIAEFQATTASLSKVVNLVSATPVTTLYTPTEAALTANTVKDGVIGDMVRVKYKSAGTYVGATTLQVLASSGAGLTQ